MCKLVLVTVFLMHSSQGLVLLLIFVCLFFSPLNSCDKYIYFYVKGKITANFIHTVYILKTLGPIFFFCETRLYFTTKCVMVLTFPSPSHPFSDRNLTFAAAGQNSSQGPWCSLTYGALRRGSGSSGRAFSTVCWKNPCSCNPAAVRCAKNQYRLLLTCPGKTEHSVRWFKEWKMWVLVPAWVSFQHIWYLFNKYLLYSGNTV